MKILVTGACGQLGFDMVKELISRGHQVTATDIYSEYKDLPAYISLDITDKFAVERVLFRVRPDAVIHCAAWTDVDAAEKVENREKVFSINVYGTENIATLCAELGCKLLYISTDYVFDGRGALPYEPDRKYLSPLNVYGQSKLLGERVITKLLDKYFIVRVSWLFGLNGHNFVKTMLDLGSKKDILYVVDDQIGTPTYSRDLSRLLADMVETQKYGFYHASNEGGYISWYDFAKEIFKTTGNNSVKVLPVSTDEYAKKGEAVRPRNSRLDKSKLIQTGFTPLPTWQNALSRYLKELNDNGTDKSDRMSDKRALHY